MPASLSLPYVRRAALEYLEYDAALLRWSLAQGATAAGRLLWSRDLPRAFQLLSRIHRSGGSEGATRRIEHLLADASRAERAGQRTGLWNFYRQHIADVARDRRHAAIVANPTMLFGYRVLVTKSPSDNERGVIVIDYSYVFPLFAALFDVEKIAARYHLVLEPSWRGLCTADILCYSMFDSPVFVQTVEPRDTAFLQAIDHNFVTIPTAANWWVDHRAVAPVPGVAKDLDIVMVAGWSDVKRHWRFFRVLAELKAAGHRLKVALVGYPQDKNRHAVEAEARQFGIVDQLELHEQLPLEQVNRLLTRAKVHVLWSRKEGANRAVVEALFADVPIIVRDGLSYGYHYPYVNPRTGAFATEASLGNTILDVIRNPGRFGPRAWAMEHMSCQRATAVMERAIRQVATDRGEAWTRSLAAKTVQLSTQRYWDPLDRERFAEDYEFLRQHQRPPRPDSNVSLPSDSGHS